MTTAHRDRGEEEEEVVRIFNSMQAHNYSSPSHRVPLHQSREWGRDEPRKKGYLNLHLVDLGATTGSALGAKLSKLSLQLNELLLELSLGEVTKLVGLDNNLDDREREKGI